jgi:hypothetical protein
MNSLLLNNSPSQQLFTWRKFYMNREIFFKWYNQLLLYVHL